MVLILLSPLMIELHNIKLTERKLKARWAFTVFMQLTCVSIIPCTMHSIKINFSSSEKFSMNI